MCNGSNNVIGERTFRSELRNGYHDGGPGELRARGNRINSMELFHPVLHRESATREPSADRLLVRRVNAPGGDGSVENHGLESVLQRQRRRLRKANRGESTAPDVRGSRRSRRRVQRRPANAVELCPAKWEVRRRRIVGVLVELQKDVRGSESNCDQDSGKM